jgi:predicted ArsR family transcriptional regulator
MSTNNKIDTTKLTTFLSKPRTSGDVAQKFTVTPATARKYLNDLFNNGVINTVGVKNTGGRGRPATQYQTY